MASPPLTAFWIAQPDRRGPLGYGVTAHSLDDALQIIRYCGYQLPDDLAMLSLTEGVRIAELHPHVQAHMGPIVVRGLWYPFSRVGL